MLKVLSNVRSSLQSRAVASSVVGNVVSLVAALLIGYLLVVVYGLGFEALFVRPLVYVLGLLVVLGVVARHAYMGMARASLMAFRRVAPVVIVLAALGVVVGGVYSPLVGGGLIVLSYLLETLVAVPLSRDLAEISLLGSRLFIYGIVLFGASLPFIIAVREAALVALLGDSIKALGLILILVNLRGKPS